MCGEAEAPPQFRYLRDVLKARFTNPNPAPQNDSPSPTTQSGVESVKPMVGVTTSVSMPLTTVPRSDITPVMPAQSMSPIGNTATYATF